MNLLTKSKSTGRDVVALAPGSLEYVNFAAYRLESGETLPLSAGENELCVVLLTGHASVSGEAPGAGRFQLGKHRRPTIGIRRKIAIRGLPAAA